MFKYFAFIILVFINLLAVFGISAIAPTIPLVVQNFNIPMSEIWILMTAFTVPGVIMAPLGGILTDRFGRKPILIIGLSIVAFSSLPMLFINSYIEILVCRGFQGVGVGMLATLGLILIGDSFNDSERARIIGLNLVIVAVIATVIPLFSGMLSQISWRIPFLFCLLAFPLLLAVILVPFPKSKSEEVQEENYLKASLSIISNPSLICWFLFGCVTYFITWGVHITYLPVFASTFFESSPTAIGQFISAGAFASAAAAFLTGKLLKKISIKSLLTVGFSMLGISNCIFFYVPFAPILYFSAICYGLAMGMCSPIIYAQVIGFTTEQTRGAVMAIHSITTRTSQALSPGIGNLLWMISPHALFGFAATISFGLLFFIKIATRKERTKS